MSVQLPYASYWLAAAVSGFANRHDWAAWADAFIVAAESPPRWVLELSLAKSVDELWTVLAQQIEQEVQRGFNRSDIHEAVLGYYWLRFERGDIDIHTCLNLAGQHADNCDTHVECEAFYSLLNRLEAGAQVEDAARELFLPYRNTANKQWGTLIHDPWFPSHAATGRGA